MARSSRGKAAPADRHQRLYKWFTRSEAWRALDPVARCAYVELQSRYYGQNNGEIPYAVREMAQALHVGKATALRALRRLEAMGFVVVMEKGAFSRKVRHATLWRLTEFPQGGHLATKDFMRWTRKNAVPAQNPNGSTSEPERVPLSTSPDRYPPSTVSAEHPCSTATVSPQGH